MSTTGASCNIQARVKDPKTGKRTGKLSLLHQGLLFLQHFCEKWTRTKANVLYNLVSTPMFQEQYNGKLILDANQEPMLVSLWEEMGKDSPIGEVTYEQMNQALNFKFKSGLYDYNEALNKAVDFNKSMEGSKSFMGYIEYDAQSGQYMFSIKPNTVENRKQFLKLVTEKQHFDTVVERLKQAGINIDQLFPTEDEQSKGAVGKYSPENYKRLSDGIHGVISLLDPNSDYKTLTVETGHLIIGSLHDSPLVNRFEKLLKDEKGLKAAASILGNEGESLIRNSQNPHREVMGHLVAKYLNDILSKEDAFMEVPAWKNLIRRICEAAKKVWKNVYNAVTFKHDLMIAESTARKLAKVFVSTDGKFGDIENAPKEILYSDNISTRSTREWVLKQVLDKMYKQAEEFKKTLGVEGDIDSLLNKIMGLQEVLINLHNQQSVPALKDYRDLYSGILKLLEAQTDYIKAATEQARADLDTFNNRQIDWDTDSDSLMDMVKLKDIALITIQAQKVKEVILSVYDTVNKENELSNSMRGNFNDVMSFASLNAQLNKLYDQFTTSNGLSDTIQSLKQGAMQLFLTSVNGCDAFYVPTHANFYVPTSEKYTGKGDADSYRDVHKERIGNKQNAQDKEDAHGPGMNNQLDIADILGPTYVTGALGYAQRCLYTYAHYPNIMVQLYHKAITQARHEAEKASCEMLCKLTGLRMEYDQKGGKHASTTRFYEIDGDTHQYTGNWVQKYHWGKFEREREEFLRQQRQIFWEQNCQDGPENAKYKDTYQAFTSKEWIDRQKRLLQGWYEQNAIQEDILDENGKPVLDPFTGERKKQWVPRLSKYYNAQYDKLTDYEKELLTKLKDIKKQLDSLLPPYMAPSHRAPQFRSDLFKTISNVAHSGDASGKKFQRWFAEWFKRYGIQTLELTGIAALTFGTSWFTLPATILSSLVWCCCRKISLRHMMHFHRTMHETEHDAFTQEDHSKCITVEHYKKYKGEAIKRDPFFSREYRSLETGKYHASLTRSFNSIRQVPIYGVRKLQDMDSLNTDPFQSLLAYAHMAYSYKAMQDVSTYGHLMSSVLQDRAKKEGADYSNDKSKDSQIQIVRDLENFMKQHVYNLKSYQMDDSATWNRPFLYIAHRMYRDMASLRTLWYLGCNLFSNFINMGTANNEIIKQGLSDTGDYKWWYAVEAIGSLAKHLFKSVFNIKGLLRGGSSFNDEKLFLISKRFNIRDMDYNNFSMSRRLGFLISIFSSDNLLLPYSTGDFIMQSITFIATLKSTKVYKFEQEKVLDENDNMIEGSFAVPVKKSSLWKAYHPVHKRKDGDFEKLPKEARDLFYRRGDDRYRSGDDEHGYQVLTEEVHNGNIRTTHTEEILDASQMIPEGLDPDDTVEINGQIFTQDELKNAKIVKRTYHDYIVFGSDKDDGAFNLRQIQREDIIMYFRDEDGNYIDEDGAIVDEDSLEKKAAFLAEGGDVLLPNLRLYYTYKADSRSDIKELDIDDDWYIEDDNLTRLVNYEEEQLRQIPSDQLDSTERQWLIHDPNNKDMLYLNPKRLGIMSAQKSKEMFKVVRRKTGTRVIDEEKGITEPIYTYNVYRLYDSERENFVKQRIRMNNQRMHGVYDNEGQNYLSTKLYGPLIMNMRKYYIGQLENNLGLPQYSIYKHSFDEGFNRTLVKILEYFIGDIVKQSFYTLKGVANLSVSVYKSSKASFNPEGFLKSERQNYVRQQWGGTYKIAKETAIDLLSIFHFAFDLAAAPLASPFIPKKWRKYVTSRFHKLGFSDSQINKYRQGCVGVALVIGLRGMMGYLAPPPADWDPDKDDDKDYDEDDINALSEEDLKAISLANQGLYKTGDAQHPQRSWIPSDKHMSDFLHRKAQQHRFSESSIKRNMAEKEEELASWLDGGLGDVLQVVGDILTAGTTSTIDGASWYNGGSFMALERLWYNTYIPEEVRYKALDGVRNPNSPEYGIVHAELEGEKNSAFDIFSPGLRSYFVNKNDFKVQVGKKSQYQYNQSDAEVIAKKNYFSKPAMWYYLAWRCNEEQVSQPTLFNLGLDSNKPIAELVNITAFEDGLSLIGTMADILVPLAEGDTVPFSENEDGSYKMTTSTTRGKTKWQLDPTSGKTFKSAYYTSSSSPYVGHHKGFVHLAKGSPTPTRNIFKGRNSYASAANEAYFKSDILSNIFPTIENLSLQIPSHGISDFSSNFLKAVGSLSTIQDDYVPDEQEEQEGQQQE